MINGPYYHTGWLTYMLEGRGLYNNDTWVISFLRGKVHGVQPDLFSRGPRGAGEARLSIVTLKGKETVSVEVNGNRKPGCETTSKQTALVFRSEKIITYRCAH